MAVHPVSVKNTFLKHLVFWVFFIPLLTLILVPVFKPEQRIFPAEVQMLAEYGIATKEVEEKTRHTFEHLFVRTHIMAYTEAFFSGKNSVHFHQKNGQWSANWIRGVWMMIFRAIWRIHAFSRLFFLPVVIFSISALLDALAIRARKKFSFEYDSPGKFYSSTHLLMLAIGLFFCIPFLPVLMTADFLAFLLFSMTMAVWVSAAHFR